MAVPSGGYERKASLPIRPVTGGCCSSRQPRQRHTIRGLAVLSAVAVTVLICAAPALGNGVDLRVREGRPGERIRIRGHDWLTCCPRNTPVRHVELYLALPARRLPLFDVAADRQGRIAATFDVPSVRPGRYELEACGRGPGDQICLPEGRFTVLPRRLAATGLPLASLLLLTALLAANGIALIATGAPRTRRVSPRSPTDA
jgi:hypothetical protein